jgi:hypothetical protein
MITWLSEVLTTLVFQEFERMVSQWYFRIKKYAFAASALFHPQVCVPTLRRLTDDVPHILQVCVDNSNILATFPSSMSG